MSDAAVTPAPLEIGFWLRRLAPLATLLALTATMGVAGLSLARAVFVVGCGITAWDLLRYGAPAHFAGSLTLFCLAPLLRRIVDVHAGYDPSGLMISGPLLGLLVVAPRLLEQLASGRELAPALRPFLLAAFCAFYATILTIFGGGIMQAVSGALKWGAPVVYGMWLFGAAKDGKALVQAAARVCMLLAPLLGIYGFLQYIDPPTWDRFWMSYTSIASIGQPEPFMVRVFSTMNAPAGYATFTAAALLLFGFGRVRLSLLLAAAPSVLGLMLSMYRTAWIALAAGLVLGLFNHQTRRRAAILLAAVPLLGAAVILLTPAGDAVLQRLETLGSVSDDASGQERLGEYAELLNTHRGTLIGNGFGGTDVMQAGAMALDGQLVISWYSMGLVVGILSVAAVAWAAVLAMRGAWRSGTVEGMAIAGIMIGALVQLPLAVISASEIGFLFWSLAAVGAALRRPVP